MSMLTIICQAIEAALVELWEETEPITGRNFEDWTPPVDSLELRLMFGVITLEIANWRIFFDADNPGAEYNPFHKEIIA